MPRRARARWYRVGVSGHPCWVPPEQRGWLGPYPLLSASRRDERPGRIHCRGREITGTGIPCRWAQRRESGRGAGSTATSAADHRRVNSSPSPARRRCTARELAGNPLVGYLLTGVTIDARPGSVEVFGRTLSHRLHECVSFGRCSEVEGIRSPVADADGGSDPAFERGAFGPRTCGSRRRSVDSTHGCRRPASSTQCARAAAEENGCGSAWIHHGATGLSHGRAGRRLSG